jgi:hypothetical protein
MKTQIEKLIVLARNIADAHMNYKLKGEMVRHTPNVRIHQLNEKENEFTSVYFSTKGVDFKVNLSSYSGVTLEFIYSVNIEEVLDLLIADVEESLIEWFASYHQDIEQIRLDAVEKKRQALIKLTNEINEMEGKS